MKHCKWDTKYPDVSKEFKCNQPATVEVFEMGGHLEWNEDKTALIKIPAKSMGWLCPEHADLFNTGRNAVNVFIGKYYTNDKVPKDTLKWLEYNFGITTKELQQ